MNISEYDLAVRVRGTQVKGCVENFPKNLIRRPRGAAAAERRTAGLH